MNKDSDTEFLIYPNLSADNRLCIGVRSVDLNANCCVRIQLPDDVVSKILTILDKAKKDMVSAKYEGKLIKETKCNPCIVKRGICTMCGEVYI